MKPRHRCCRFLLSVTVILLPVATVAAPHERPDSASRTNLKPLGQVAQYILPPVDVERLLAEDAARRSRTDDVPYRVGEPVVTDLAPSNSGTWEELPEGGRIWRLRVHSPGALWMVVGFGTYRLQPGGRLFVYDPGLRQPHGPYTSNEIRRHGELWFPPIEGDTVIVELHWPEELRGLEPNLHLGTVSHGYKELAGWFDDFDGLPGDDPVVLGSGSCNIDVNCPLGDEWQDEKRGVLRTLSGAGSAFCSGSLINTTAEDCRPYVLTARHCISTPTSAASTSIQLGYERPACESGTPASTTVVTGATILGTYGASDATLLEMDEEIPEESNAFFNGWTRSTTPATESWGIHHPSCDYMKISFNSDALVDGQNWGPDHWRVTEWELGTTEPCSSGSPLFDQNHRIVGQLHGGTASCSSITYDEYGKLDVSWGGGGTPASRLSDWLDPAGTGALAIDGIDLGLCLIPRPQLRYTGHAFQDLLGAGDGIADPGEALALEVDLHNAGNLMATMVRGTLDSPDQGVALAGNPAEWPDIDVSEEKTSLQPFVNVQLDPALACGQLITLQLETTAAETVDSWHDEFQLRLGDPSISVHFADDMESGANGWTTEALVGTLLWTQVTDDSSSGSTSWFVADTLARRDTALIMPTLVALPANAVLRFNHRYNTQANLDGGVLEFSTDGGSSWLDAAAMITDGGYNGVIGSTGSPPLQGRPAWSGDSGGWITTTVDLASLAGNDVALRWRFGSNLLIGDEGWYVDDAVIDTTDYVCNALALPPGEASPPVVGRDPFRIEIVTGGLELSWSAPVDGAAATGYRLYSTPLGAGVDPVCVGDLGSGNAALLSTLPDDSGFVVVAFNSVGEGSYGLDGNGSERPDAQAGAVCP